MTENDLDRPSADHQEIHLDVYLDRSILYGGDGDNPIRDMNLYMWWPGYHSITPTIDWLDWDLEG